MNNALANFYGRHHRLGSRLDQSFQEEQRARLFGPWIGSGVIVLDLGCRDGQLTRHFMAGNQVTGADIDSNALATARERHGLETRALDLNQPLPWEDGSFDRVLMAEVLEHLPYPRLTLGEIHRVLRPGGLFIGNLPLAYHLKDRWQVLRGRKLAMAGDPTHLQFFTFAELRSLLESFFVWEAFHVIKGGRLGRQWPENFARNVAFKVRKALQ
ncbi:MAG: methyltransferase domain-containing protein [Magnetococcus sp. WYHC-3]